MTIETAHTESAREGPPLSQQIVSEIGERLAELGLSLCHIEWKKGRQRSVLTLTIDRPSGVTLHDCEGATRAVENLLEPVETLGESWVLEVESPGLDRRLYTLEDFRRFTFEHPAEFFGVNPQFFDGTAVAPYLKEAVV